MIGTRTFAGEEEILIPGFGELDSVKLKMEYLSEFLNARDFSCNEIVFHLGSDVFLFHRESKEDPFPENRKGIGHYDFKKTEVINQLTEAGLLKVIES